jgi:hypothetical protein
VLAGVTDGLDAVTRAKLAEQAANVGLHGGAYDDEPPAGRPKYGSLNFRGRRVGGSPRFGSAHLRLTRAALLRATFCYPDSFLEPGHFGVAARVSHLVAMAAADDTDPLDDYVEAHVHGVLVLPADVEALASPWPAAAASIPP